MNCSPTIAIALLLLSLTAGTWLLYKTQKENLSVFFKVVGWFIIVVSIGSMICCGVRCIYQSCRQNQACSYSTSCGMNRSDCKMRGGKYMMGRRGMNKCVMIMKGEDGCCSDSYREEKGCCREGKDECEESKINCCKKDSDKCKIKMRIEKDSVVVKK